MFFSKPKAKLTRSNSDPLLSKDSSDQIRGRVRISDRIALL